MNTRVEVNEEDDYVQGNAIISKKDHFFFKKVMRERVITFKDSKVDKWDEIAHIVDLTPELIQVPSILKVFTVILVEIKPWERHLWNFEKAKGGWWASAKRTIERTGLRWITITRKW